MVRCVSALFYGTSNDSIIGDISLVLYESLLGFIPMFILEKFIKEHAGSTDQITGTAIDPKKHLKKRKTKQLLNSLQNSNEMGDIDIGG